MHWVHVFAMFVHDRPRQELQMDWYILGIENARDLEDYLKTLLDFNNPNHRRFLTELIRRRQTVLGKGDSNVQGYKKPVLEQDYFSSKQTEKKKKGCQNVEESPLPPAKDSGKEQQAQKKKHKFVNLYSQEGQAKDVVLLKGQNAAKPSADYPNPSHSDFSVLAVTIRVQGKKENGRHPCECQASKHRLINNCLKCGRIVCEQEGSGPCLFCYTLVCSQDEQTMLQSGSKQGDKLYQKLMGGAKQDTETALQHRDRLLEYDRTSERRTRVIDDESDYFAANSVWLSSAEREKMREKEKEQRDKRHASRLDKRVTLDFAGRQVLEEEDGGDQFDPEEILREMAGEGIMPNIADMDDRSQFPEMLLSQALVSAALYGTSSSYFEESVEGQGPHIRQETVVLAQFQDSPIVLDPESLSSLTNSTPDRSRHRVQDREFLEMCDEGYCLSMHQPWASLLVAGIKEFPLARVFVACLRHEGRTWYTAHRGRLWIAAGSKPPSPQEIGDTEHVYRILKGGESRTEVIFIFIRSLLARGLGPSQLYQDSWSHWSPGPRLSYCPLVSAVDEDLRFPTQYPVSCLLGCVNVVDCLPQEEYRTRFPEGESDSPFVFICQDPHELPVRFPVQGKHKIYKLDSKIHQAAQKSLQRVIKIRAEKHSRR
uniref:Activating signal cointegrator 1 n=1 Tax=Timema genevievae TaxID=629358 RepID=A0A7R9K444_TIMGE|nr:unnamed protein product [Timema genevievae]